MGPRCPHRDICRQKVHFRSQWISFLQNLWSFGLFLSPFCFHGFRASWSALITILKFFFVFFNSVTVWQFFLFSPTWDEMNRKWENKNKKKQEQETKQKMFKKTYFALSKNNAWHEIKEKQNIIIRTRKSSITGTMLLPIWAKQLKNSWK